VLDLLAAPLARAESGLTEAKVIFYIVVGFGLLGLVLMLLREFFQQAGSTVDALRGFVDKIRAWHRPANKGGHHKGTNEPTDADS
jgi:hypothetical protein